MARRLEPKVEFVATDGYTGIATRAADESLYDAFRRKYPLYADNIKDRFEKANGEAFEWESISPPALDRFIQYLRACGLSDNSVNQYGHKLMAVLNLYRDLHKEYVPSAEVLSSILDTPLDQGYEVALTDDEINSLYKYLKKLMESEHVHEYRAKCDRVQYEIEVLSHFLLSADTGARSFDEKGLTWNNVSEGFDEDGNPIYILTYTTNKKGVKASLPIAIDSRVVPLLRNIMPLTVEHSMCNRLIKFICRKAGLTRKVKRRRAGKDEVIDLCNAVHFHLARKCYVTNSLKKGASITDVMQFVGHTNPQQTMHYNCGGPSFKASVVSKQIRQDESNSLFQQ